MARREATKKNELLLNDNISGTVCGLYFRMPTTEERQAYQNSLVQRKGRKIKRQTAATRVRFGLKILTGVRAGDYERSVDDGYQAIVTDEGEDGYYPGWKDWMQEHAADHVMILAAHVFEASVGLAEPDGDDDPDDSEDAEKN